MSVESLIVATPFGRALALEFAKGEIVASGWVASRRAGANGGARRGPLARETCAQLDAYFAKRLPVFDLPLHLEGTELELAAWRAVATIPFGTFVPYGEVARAIGRDGSARGVARAMSRAPLDLFIPAHRIVGSDGRVRGAEPGSMRLKLMAFERSESHGESLHAPVARRAKQSG